MAEATRQVKAAMLERIDDMESMLDTAVIGTLSACGWKHTSSTPDSVWRWVKTLPPPSGVTIMVDQATALRIERSYL